MSQFDFNINNYTITDLEKFLKLSLEYNEFEIKEKERILRNQLIKAIENEKVKSKRKAIEKNAFQFLDEAKRLLIEKLKKAKMTENSILINKNDTMNSITSYLQPISTFPTTVAQGNLNTLRKKISTYSLCMNTLFRDTNGSNATESLFILPYPMKNVISMKLSSVEFPDTVYMISEKKRTNRFFIKEDGTDKQGIIIIPEGNYTSETMPAVLQNAINEKLDSDERFSVEIDEHNGKTIIKNCEHTFVMQFINNETNPVLSKNLGWSLGFRNANYIRSRCYISESIFCPIPVQYIYFILNDFNISNSTTIMGIFSDNYVEKNILAKIPIHVDSFQIMFDNNSDLISKKREYFGTVDVNKFSIKILDIYGEPVDLNNMDFSFTLEFEIAYDI